MQYVPPIGGAANDPYVDAQPAAGIEGSAVPAAAIEHPQREIMEVIAAAGLAGSSGDLTQLRQAIAKMIADGAHSVRIKNAAFAAGVVDGQVVRWDAANNRFDKALADGTAAARAVGIADVTNAEVVAFGQTRAGLLAGLTPGARYYLSAAAAGALIDAAPTDVVFLGIAKAADTLFVDVDPALVATVSADIPFLAGRNADWSGADLAVQGYGEVVLARNLKIEGEVATLGVAATGADLILDVARNGVSIYTTKPKFAAGATVLTPGILDAAQVDAVAGDVLTFSLTQVGATIRGQKLALTVKAKVR